MQDISKFEIIDDDLISVVGGVWSKDAAALEPKFADGDRVRTVKGKCGVICGEGYGDSYFSGDRSGNTIWYKLLMDNGERLKFPEWELSKV